MVGVTAVAVGTLTGNAGMVDLRNCDIWTALSSMSVRLATNG